MVPGAPPLVGAAVLLGMGRTPGDPATRPLTVLLVEKQASDRMMGRELLERAEHTCHTAGDWPAAMRILMQVPLDALLLDLDCPGAAGLETVREMRGWPVPLGLLAVLGIVGRMNPGQREAARKVDLDALLIRPLQADSTEDMLRQAVIDRTPPEALDPAVRSALRAELGEAGLREKDEAAMAVAGGLLRALRESAGLPAVRVGAAKVAEAMAGIGAVAVAKAARELAETPGRRPALLPILFNRLMTARQAVRRG